LLLPSITTSTKRIGIVGRYSTDNLPINIAKHISGGLTEVDSGGNVTSKIAKSWESFDDGKTWDFKIDTSIKWQDGKKVKPDDIVYKFSDATSEIVDNETIRFKLNSKFSAFPIILSKPIFKKGLLGTGEWEVKKVSLSGGYLQKLTLSDTKKNKIIYRFFPSESQQILAFKLGQIDEMQNVYEIEEFKNWKTVRIEENIRHDNFVALFFNTESEKFKDKTARQSLAYAVEKDGFNERAIGPISIDSWAYNSQVKLYNRDLEKTKEIGDLSVSISTLPNLLKTAEKIKKDWEEAGVKVEIQVVTSIPDNFDVFLATVDIPKDPDQYSLWHSTQTSTNISKLKNPRIDKLLEDGRTELDQESRKKIYLDFQRFLVEEVPAVFLYYPTQYNVVRK